MVLRSGSDGIGKRIILPNPNLHPEPADPDSKPDTTLVILNMDDFASLYLKEVQRVVDYIRYIHISLDNLKIL